MVQTRRDFLKKTAALSAASYVGMQLPIDAQTIARAAEGEAWHRGTCRLCGVGCRVELGVKNGVPFGLRGIADSRTNYGYLCMKGMHFWKCMGHKDRLKKPLYRAKKSESFKEISWDKALDIAADRFADAVIQFFRMTAAQGLPGLQIRQVGLRRRHGLDRLTLRFVVGTNLRQTQRSSQ